MKIRAFVSLTAMFSAAQLFAAEGNFLNAAILTLPPKYFADIPLNERRHMLLTLSFRPEDLRLDYASGWLHFHQDSEEVMGGTSMIYLKLLSRRGTTPLVFVHMPKPYANGSKPVQNQTFVLEHMAGRWRDVTGSVFPGKLDRTLHFRPRRKFNQIEVAPYKEVSVWQGKRAYHFGLCSAILRWDGVRLQQEKIAPRELSDD